MPKFVKLPSGDGYIYVNAKRVTHILEWENDAQCVVSFGLPTDGVVVDLEPAEAMMELAGQDY